MDFSKFLFGFLFLIFFQVPTAAQDWVSYQSQQQINDLVDTGAELFLATDAGLVVLNKQTFEKTIYNKGNTSLTNNHIPTITQAPNGDIWIGTYDVTLMRFADNDFEDISTPEGVDNPITHELYDLEIAPNGDFWIGTSEGVFHKEGQSWAKYAEAELGDDFFKVWDIEFDTNGEIFFASSDVHKYADGEWISILEDTDFLNYQDAEIFVSSNGDLFVAGDTGRIGRYNGEEWEDFEISAFDEELSGAEIIGFTEDLEGNIFLNTKYNGLYKFVADNWAQVEDVELVEFGNEITYFYIDTDNDIWINNGIQLTVSSNGETQSTIISQHTIKSNSLRAMTKDSEGNMYFTSWYGNPISVLSQEGEWSIFPEMPPLSDFGYIIDLLVIEENNIWVLASSGSYHYNGIEWLNNGSINGNGIIADAEGKVYIRSSNGVYIINGEEIVHYSTENSSIESNGVSGHGIDENGNLWLAFYEENIVQSLSVTGTWTTYSGLDFPAIHKPKGDFYFDEEGNVWVPSGIVGAMQFDGLNWSNPFEGNFEIIDNIDVHSIESDASGKMYFSHHFGVTTLRNGQWENLIIEDVPNNYSHISALQFDNNGTLWWASERYGLFSYTPALSTWIDESSAVIVVSAKAYPNPARDNCTLEFLLVEKAQVNISVFNNLGQLQSRLDLGELPVGSFQESLNVALFPKGLYTIRLQVNEVVTSHSLIVQ